MGKLQPQISPALRQLCKWECDVVAHYSTFKEAAFPGAVSYGRNTILSNGV